MEKIKIKLKTEEYKILYAILVEMYENRKDLFPFEKLIISEVLHIVRGKSYISITQYKKTITCSFLQSQAHWLFQLLQTNNYERLKDIDNQYCELVSGLTSGQISEQLYRRTQFGFELLKSMSLT